MVSFVNSNYGSETVYKRRRAEGSSPPSDALTPVQRCRTDRCRKQTLISKLSDSGFDEDLESSLTSSTPRVDVSLLRSNRPPAGQLSSWFLQYGDVGFQIQRDREAHYQPRDCLAQQPQLTPEARCTLVSWLMPVHKHFHLSFECCCLAVNIMDRFLASTPMSTDCFQLLGVTALFLASKQVEVCSPQISHLLSFCCDAFTREQLCNLECLILVRLNFRLAAPTVAFFLDYYTNCLEATRLVSDNAGDGRVPQINPDAQATPRCSHLALKVCELSLADYVFNKYPPSMTAGCALWLANDLLRSEQGLVEHSNIHTQEDQWARFVHKLCMEPASAQPSESPKFSEEKCLSSLRGGFLSVSGGNYSHNLAQECKDNLKLLVSLNQETLTSSM